MNAPARHCALLLALTACTPLLADEALGRLFFGAERRAALDRMRASNITESQQQEEVSLTVNGVVRRSSGKDTAWINGSPQTSAAEPRAWDALGRRNPAQVSVLPPGEASRSLAVGETWHRSTGEIETPLQAGRIVVTPKRPGAAKP